MTPNALLPLRALVITLEVIKESRPAFFHQAALMAFLRFLAESPDNFDHYIRLDAPESGRIHYLPGDYYRFTLIGLEGERPSARHHLTGPGPTASYGTQDRHADSVPGQLAPAQRTRRLHGNTRREAVPGNPL